MAIIIGMDEAGYGPNLGPLVVTATVWQTPDDLKEPDFWITYQDVVTRRPPVDPRHIHVDDSKRVYQVSRGLKNLERSVLCVLGLLNWCPGSFRSLWDSLAIENLSETTAPWFEAVDLPLPVAADAESISEIASRWQEVCESCGIRLKTIRSDIVLPQRFNQIVREFDNKSEALSRTSLGVLKRVWCPDTSGPALVVADKHGGRNRYDYLLQDAFQECLFFRIEEGQRRSVYRTGESEIRFEMKAESHFPVAIASMVSKYVRELAMELFNRFWQARIDGLKPTKGYPVDAKRFKADIADEQQRLGIPDDVLWRER